MNKTGINTKLLRVFVLQVVFISTITVLGVYAAAKVVEGVMMRAALEGEAQHFWRFRDHDPTHPLPNTDNLVGYLSTNGESDALPAELRGLEPGYGRHKLLEGEPLVYVQQHGPSRLYLVFDAESVTRLSVYFGVVPLSLALLVIYVSAWFAYRLTRKAVSPVVRLANAMEQFDLESQSRIELKLDDLGEASSNDEVDVLIEALASFTDRINAMIDRERNFTRDASHELRTPLTVIQGSAEWLRMQPGLDERQGQAVERILRTSRDMGDLVRGLLLLARGDKQRFEAETVDVNALVDRLLSDIQQTHNVDKHVAVTVRHDSRLVLQSSSQVLSIIIGNLLKNAFNYTREGEVSVVISEHSVQVANRGSGVQEVDTTKLFEPFYRGPQAHQSPGHGIGLDIVRRLCEYFDWGISAAYSVESGMVFTLDVHNA